MKLTAFLRDKCLLLLLHLICMALLSAFLHITGSTAANIALICIFWLMILSAWLLVTFLGRRKYYKEVFHILENTDKRWLLGEMMPDSFSLEDKLHREMLRRSNRSVIEKIRLLEDAQREYREYLESWVHEIKAPISAITLSCQNGKDLACREQSSADIVLHQTFRSIRQENRKIENYVDMVLYYARSGQVSNDYLIKETELAEIIYEALEKERLLLIRNHVRAEVSCAETVYTDKKWCVFILNQLILNSIKYGRETPVLRFYAARGDNNITLTVEDNGKGIPAEDLPRIFEKGFTGRNGRDAGNATGMGLYLCKKLCDRLGIGLCARSAYGSGTKMLLSFPVSSYITGSILTKM